MPVKNAGAQHRSASENTKCHEMVFGQDAGQTALRGGVNLCAPDEGEAVSGERDRALTGSLLLRDGVDGIDAVGPCRCPAESDGTGADEQRLAQCGEWVVLHGKCIKGK